MKKLFIVISCICVLIGSTVGLVFFMTSEMTKTADTFLSDIQLKNFSNAYSHLSNDFQNTISEPEFTSFLTTSSLASTQKFSWNSRSISGSIGELQGSITTSTGNTINLQSVLIKEDGTWKIFSLFIPQAGIVTHPSGKLPDNTKLVALIDTSLLKFAESVNAKDFSAFHSHIAYIWQKQTSIEQFKQIFQPFVDKEINMLPAINSYTPIFEPLPIINEEDILVVQGHYPTQPQLQFKLKYIYEGIKWKLMGINVDIK